MEPAVRLEASLRDRWISWRNRTLADPRFQRWAADFPLTRGVARRRALGLFDLVSGFVYSQTLTACLQLNLLKALAGGPLSTDALTHATGLPPDGLRRLLGAAAALGLIETAGPDRWALGADGAILDGDAGLVSMILHNQNLYADLSEPTRLFRGAGEGQLAAFWPYSADGDPVHAPSGAARAYSALMAATQPTVARDILDAYPVGRHRRLLDVGGGEGVFLAAAAARAPGLQLMLLDLPPVAAIARTRLGSLGLADRLEVFEGNFLGDALPRGADLISLVRVLHDQDDARATLLLRAARRALPPHGALLLAEPMSAAPQPDRVADVYFAFYLLAMGRGRARTPLEVADLLRTAGFRRTRPLRTRSPHLLRAVLARP
jgi:demethylspheroidene O-methyltransferase